MCRAVPKRHRVGLASNVVAARNRIGHEVHHEELFEDLGIGPRTVTLRSNGAIRASVQAGLGITLISRDAVERELAEGQLEEWRGKALRRQWAWHVVGRAGEHLPPTAALFVDHLVAQDTPAQSPFQVV